MAREAGTVSILRHRIRDSVPEARVHPNPVDTERSAHPQTPHVCGSTAPASPDAELSTPPGGRCAPDRQLRTLSVFSDGLHLQQIGNRHRLTKGSKTGDTATESPVASITPSSVVRRRLPKPSIGRMARGPEPALSFLSATG